VAQEAECLLCKMKLWGQTPSPKKISRIIKRKESEAQKLSSKSKVEEPGFIPALLGSCTRPVFLTFLFFIIHPCICVCVCVCVCVCGVGDGTQHLKHTKQTPYPWATCPAPKF
jgi:hypothetical protein